MRALLATLVIALLSGCSTQMSSGGSMAGSARDEVAQATAAWAAAFNSREPARITALYHPEAVFWGTSSKTVAKTPAAVAEYFKNMPKAPNGRVALGEQNIRVLGDMAINTGYYTFTLPNGPAPARYSFVFKREDGKWLIVDHHSSQVP